MRLENVYSQCGEDGILKHIIETLRIVDGTLVEFGAWDGFYLSNVQNLFQNNKNFHVVFIEPEEDRFKQLLDKNQHPNICCLKDFITFEENYLVNLLKGRIHGQLQVLSMDTDNDDFRIWNNNKSLRPVVVVIEPANWQVATKRNELYTGFKNDGYSLAFVTGNFIFVRDDFFSQLGISYNHPEELFQKCQHVEFCLDRGLITKQQLDVFLKKYYYDAQANGNPCRTWMYDDELTNS